MWLCSQVGWNLAELRQSCRNKEAELKQKIKKAHPQHQLGENEKQLVNLGYVLLAVYWPQKPLKVHFPGGRQANGKWRLQSEMISEQREGYTHTLAAGPQESGLTALSLWFLVHKMEIKNSTHRMDLLWCESSQHSALHTGRTSCWFYYSKEKK